MALLDVLDYTLTSALGRGRAAHVTALREERTGLRRQRFEVSDIDCHVGEVDGLRDALPPSLAAFDCRNHRLAWLALQQDGFLESVARLRERCGPRRIGVFAGTTTAGMLSAEMAFRQCAAASSMLPDWFDYRHTQSLHSVAELIAAALSLQGVALTVSTACSSSAKVFAAAWRALRAGLCDAAVVGGVDSLCLTTLHGFNALQLVGTDICRPADVARKGISIGEAAGFALVTLPEAQQATAARGTLLGYGESSDAHHMSTPHPEGAGAAAAMRAALSRGGLDAAQIDYINLHGTGTVANDAAEDRALHTVFGTATPCSSTKGWTGHTLGAAGIVEAGIGWLCIEHGLQPRSLNTRELDPAFNANILLQSRQVPTRCVLSNSFGFGGSNCTLVLGSAP